MRLEAVTVIDRLSGRRAVKRLVSVLVSVLFCVGCGGSAKIDQMKFDGVYRAGKAMEGATGVGVNLLKYRELVQAFASEVSIANDRAQTGSEREMVAQYAKALKAYKDAGDLWTRKLQGGAELTVGSDPELLRIARDEDYSIDGTGSGSGFRFKLDDAVQSLWRTGRGRLTEATRLYTGQAPKDLPEPR
jgi:hypothetical protein